MSALEHAMGDYLALRRALGHELSDARWLLPRFVEFLDSEGACTVTVELALAWSQQPTSHGGRSIASRRMTVARGFARFLTGTDPRTEIPPHRLVAAPGHPRRPFLFAPGDIQRLLETTDQLIESSLRSATYRTLFGLLAASGLRIGEAIKLDRTDLDWTEGVLLIRESKFGKSRLVPLHPSGVAALREYSEMRDHLQPQPLDAAFFLSRNRKRLIYAVGPTHLPCGHRRSRHRN
jgi:integrase